jgi:hypothetical protein
MDSIQGATAQPIKVMQVALPFLIPAPVAVVLMQSDQMELDKVRPVMVAAV